MRLMNRGGVYSLQICPGHRQAMAPRSSIKAICNLRLKGNCPAIRDSTRQILLAEKGTLDDLNLAPGLIREKQSHGRRFFEQT